MALSADFNQFKRQAKELLKAYRAGDASAVAEVERHEQAPGPAAFALHDAQRVLARSYGLAKRTPQPAANRYLRRIFSMALPLASSSMSLSK